MNINYATGFNKERDNLFVKNVTKDLWLRGFDNENLPNDKEQRILLLRKCLHTGIQVSWCRNDLILNKVAQATQLLNPGIFPTCILHGKMRMVEKLIHQLILAGLRKNATGQNFTQFCFRVEDTVNNDILARHTS